MATISINGMSFSGDNITIIDNDIIIDGKSAIKVPENTLQIKITGTLNSVSCDRSLNVCGLIQGDVEAKGSINCDDVNGNVIAGGSVNCDKVRGNIQASGSVNRG